MTLNDLLSLRELELEPIGIEEAEEVLDELINGEACAYTLPVSREILIFAHKIESPRELERTIFYENYHNWLVGKYGKDGRRIICEHFLDAAQDIYPKLYDGVKKSYKDKSLHAEEFMCHVIEYFMLRGGLEGNVYRYLMPVDRKIFDNFLNDIGYERETEEASRQEEIFARRRERMQRRGAYTQTNEGAYFKGDEEVRFSVSARDRAIARDAYDRAQSWKQSRGGGAGWLHPRVVLWWMRITLPSFALLYCSAC